MKAIFIFIFAAAAIGGVAGFSKQRYEVVMYNHHMTSARESISYFDIPSQDRGHGSEERKIAFQKAMDAWIYYKDAEYYLDYSQPILVKQHKEEMANAFEKIKAYATSKAEYELIQRYPALMELVSKSN